MEQFIAKTESGLVRGHLKGGIVEYLGIPYAKPPVGELRFKRAQPAEKWDGVLDAREYGPPSVQFERDRCIGSEDCLTINVKRPLDGNKLPVFVYIHGGGYNTGSCASPMLSGDAFAQDGMVFVAFQYRLNVLGFYDFSTYPGCEWMDTNCGLSDMILAMQWIHKNIAAFGGDPERVTICGESAGGAAVVTLMATPGAKGTFQQAIAQSALPYCVSTPELARRNMDLFIEGMGWKEKDLIKLKDMPAYDMQKGNSYLAAVHQQRNPGMLLPNPSIDDLLPVPPVEAIKNGCAKDIKLIIGTTLNEGTMFVRPEGTVFPNSWEMTERFFSDAGCPERYEKAKAFYEKPDMRFLAGGPITEMEPFIRIATDYAFQAPSIQVADGQKANNPDVWMYRYEFLTEGAKKSGWRAAHASELPSVFGIGDPRFRKFAFAGETDEAVEKIYNDVHGAWARFAKTGDPGAEWGRYEGWDSPVRIFDHETSTEQLDRTDIMEIWNDHKYFL